MLFITFSYNFIEILFYMRYKSNMNLNQLKYLSVTAEELNISKAAEKLYISQPSLSKSIKQLEEEIGTQIFTRKPFRLTYAGEIFVNWANNVLVTYKQVSQQIADIVNEKDIKLTIGMSPYRGTFLLPEIAAKFKEEYPDCNLIIEEHPANILHKMLDDEKIDLMLDIPYGGSSVYESIVVAKEKILLGIPQSWNYEKTSADLFDFKEKPFILLTESQFIGQLGRKLCRQCGFSPKIFMECHNIETVCSLVKKGLGVSFIPEIFIKNQENIHNMKCLPINHFYPEREIAVIYNKNNYLPKAAYRLIEILRESF